MERSGKDGSFIDGGTSGDAVSLLFSGGSDSTLVAARMLERYRTVHLLTFTHRGMYFPAKVCLRVEALRRKYGEDRFVHHVEDADPLFVRLLHGTRAEDRERYGRAFLLMAPCGVCKLAFHTLAIRYNLAHGIRDSVSGAVATNDRYMEQLRPVLDVYGALHRTFGLTYSSPIYEAVRTDLELFRLGITEEESLKYERIIFSSQQTCLYGAPVGAWGHFIYEPVWGRARREELSVQYIGEKLRVAEAFLRECLSGTTAAAP